MVPRSSTSNSDVFKVVKKLILFIALFWLVSSSIYLIINYMYFNSFGGNSGAQMNHVIRTDYDAYIFGSSRASRHYDPMLISQRLGLSCFNAGCDRKNATYQYGLLQLLLKSHVPKLIIYEIGDLSESLNGGTIDLYPYYYQNSFIRQLLNQRDYWAKSKFLFPLYSYNLKVFTVAKGFILSTPPFETGFRPKEGRMHPGEVRRIKKTANIVSPEEPIDYKALENFKNFVRICNENKIELIFCHSPSYAPSQAPGLEKIKAIAATIDAPIYLYGEHESFMYQPELFKDAIHLNREGAKLFTKLLIEDILAEQNQ